MNITGFFFRILTQVTALVLRISAFTWLLMAKKKPGISNTDRFFCFISTGYYTYWKCQVHYLHLNITVNILGQESRCYNGWFIHLFVHIKIKKYHTVKTVQKSNRKIVEWGKIDTAYKLLRDRSLFWLGKVTSIKSGLVKLVLRDHSVKYQSVILKC